MYTTQHNKTWRSELFQTELRLFILEKNRENPRWPTVNDAEIQDLKNRIPGLRHLAAQEEELGPPPKDVEIPAFLRQHAD